MEKRANFLIWDLDDTITYNRIHYIVAMDMFVRFMKDKYGSDAPSEKEIIGVQEKIDSKRYTEGQKTEEKGLSRHRFPGSTVMAFEKLCNDRALEYTNDDLVKVLHIGRYAFDENMWEVQSFKPGAEEVLQYCKDKGDIMYLLTKGDPVVQERKIDVFGLENYFGNNMRTVWSKSAEVFTEIYGDHPRERCYAIGDSPSDFKPFPEVTGVHIPVDHWAGQKAVDSTFDETGQKIIVLDDIREIRQNYDIIFS